jgi:hypothetical protein
MRLLNDATLRSELSAAGRQIVRDHMTIEANAWRWWEAWTDALKMERGPLGVKRPQSIIQG